MKLKEININDNKESSKGRNGYFKAHNVEIACWGNKTTSLNVYSKTIGRAAPIVVCLDDKNWLKIINTMLGMMGDSFTLEVLKSAHSEVLSQAGEEGVK